MGKPQDIDYEALVRPALQNFRPARRLWPVSIQLLVWMIVGLGVMCLIFVAVPRSDLLAKLDTVHYSLELGIFVLLGTFAAGLALRTALPDREATPGELAVLALIAAIGIALVVQEPAPIAVSLQKFLDAGIRCALCTGLLAALPWCALFWAVRRGATLMPELAGGLIGIAAFSFGFAASRLGCPIDNAAHILLWHVLPLGLGTGLSVVAGIAWLQRGADKIHRA